MVAFECSIGLRFNATIAVSEQDKALFQREYGWENVFAIDTAVDEEFFTNVGTDEIPGRVVFLGSMDWMPNQDGVRWFVREVWPQIRLLHPEATFHIVGRNPPAEITALSAIAGVTVVGSVADVRPHLAEAAVVVVPLLVGGGTRLKIYEAMAMNRAVVSTGIGAEGLPVLENKHYLKADDASSFAEAVSKLLSSPELRRSIGDVADQFVRQHYGSLTVARQFEEICKSVVTRTNPAGD
jgi:glycosyltransferase involved in cell wall biosynthesis